MILQSANPVIITTLDNFDLIMLITLASNNAIARLPSLHPLMFFTQHLISNKIYTDNCDFKLHETEIYGWPILVAISDLADFSFAILNPEKNVQFALNQSGLKYATDIASRFKKEYAIIKKIVKTCTGLHLEELHYAASALYLEPKSVHSKFILRKLQQK